MATNALRKRESFQTGKRAESLFERVAKKAHFKVHKANRDQNMNQHIDFFISCYHFNFSVDVKARKKISRGDSEVNDAWTWIEFKNVIGKDGWIKGKADFIAFEFENSFLIVKRAELRELCKKLIKDTKTRVTKAKDAKYLLYTRHGRKDLVTQIKLSDIKNNLKTWDWCK